MGWLLQMKTSDAMVLRLDLPVHAAKAEPRDGELPVKEAGVKVCIAQCYTEDQTKGNVEAHVEMFCGDGLAGRHCDEVEESGEDCCFLVGSLVALFERREYRTSFNRKSNRCVF